MLPMFSGAEQIFRKFLVPLFGLQVSRQAHTQIYCTVPDSGCRQAPALLSPLVARLTSDGPSHPGWPL